MKSLTCALTLLLAILVAPPESAAIILYGKDNNANQTDPGNGAPWSHVARVTNSSGTAVTTGSAVYLGNRYMLTANHVAPNNNATHITFDGAQTLAIEAGSFQQVTEGLDLKVFRLSENPGLSSLMLYEEFMGNEDLSRSTVQVGWGVGRDPTVEPNTNSVPWGGSSTVAKRWGTNTTLADSTTVAYTLSDVSYSYEGLQTRLLNTAGADEAAMTLYDSGAALFQLINGEWYLSGIATSVQRTGESVFGNAGPAPLGRGDTNSFVRISAYSENINAIVPEPSTWALIAGFAALGLAVVCRRAKRGASGKA